MLRTLTRSIAASLNRKLPVKNFALAQSRRMAAQFNRELPPRAHAPAATATRYAHCFQYQKIASQKKTLGEHGHEKGARPEPCAALYHAALD